MCNKCRRDCEDCARLVEKYGEDNLDECEFCGHYYYGEKCTCRDGMEEEVVIPIDD